MKNAWRTLGIFFALFCHLLLLMCSIFAHAVCNFALLNNDKQNYTAMRKNDKISTCVLGGNKFASALSHVNTVFNLFGIMFFVTFLGYIAIHCF